MTYKELLILKLSNIIEWRNDREMIVPRGMMEDYLGYFFTCEFLGDKKYILRGYYKNWSIWCKEEYREDQLHGKFTTYYENGQVEVEDEWQNDLPHGKSIWYYENGQVWCKEEYQNGELIRTIE